MALTPEAKAEIAAAVAIVREDRLVRHIRSSFPRVETTPEPVVDGPPAPPVKPVVEPEVKKGRKSAYWGEIMDDDEE